MNFFQTLSILVILILQPSIKSFAQTSNVNSQYTVIDTVKYLANYSYEFLEDSTSIDSRIYKLMTLYIGKNLSKFEHSRNYTSDSLWLHCGLEGRNRTLYVIKHNKDNRSHMFTQYRLIKEKNSACIDLYERMMRKNYHIHEEIDFKWQLITVKDTIIAGYKCQEAQTLYRGRTFRAWYTLSVPVNDGPYKFKGLPGLIVKLEDTQKEHCFELVSFKKIKYNKPIYLPNRDWILTDADQYQHLKHTEALLRTKRVSTQVQDILPEQAGLIEAKILSRNNLIERY